MKKPRIFVRCPECKWRSDRVSRLGTSTPFGRCIKCHAPMVDARPVTPDWRHQRAIKTGNIVRERFRAEMEARGDKYATKGVAYQAGYHRGYTTAMNWWKRKFEREQAAG